MPRHRSGTLAIALLASCAAASLGGCGSAARDLEAAQAMEAQGDMPGAIAAYETIHGDHPHGRYGDEARDSAQRVRQALAESAVADGAPGFDLPEGCETVEIQSVEQAEAGAWVELSLSCNGATASTRGRVISPDKVWDLSPVSGVLQEEGFCVFRSHGNPLGDWALQVPTQKCQAQQQLRQGTLDRLGQTGGDASFECDCRLGEALFEVPRGEPGWRSPPKVYTDKEGRIIDAPL